MKRDKPTILHYFHDFNGWGGIVTYLSEILPKLQATSNFNIAFVGTKDSRLSQHLKQNGIQVYGFPFDEAEQQWKSRFLLESLYGEFYLRRYMKQFQTILQATKPALIHTHMGEGDHFDLIRSGIPVVRTFHGSFYKVAYQGQNPMKRMYHQWCLHRFSRVAQKLAGMTLVSRYELSALRKERCLPQSEMPTQVIHNGIDIHAFRQRVSIPDQKQLRQALDLPADDIVIGLFCRLAIDKNAAAFLRIIREFCIRLRHTIYWGKVHFLVAGQGPQETLFREAANDPLLQGIYHYLGFRTDIPNLLHACTMTLNLSLNEGFGLSVLESLALGRPCIAYAAGGIPEILTIPTLPESDNWLIPVGSECNIVEALLDLIQQPEETFNSWEYPLYQHALQFDLSKHVPRLTEFYRTVLKQDLEYSSIPELPNVHPKDAVAEPAGR
jgi:glycosyltransferase involved in cell wall biosynthesis